MRVDLVLVHPRIAVLPIARPNKLRINRSSSLNSLCLTVKILSEINPLWQKQGDLTEVLPLLHLPADLHLQGVPLLLHLPLGLVLHPLFLVIPNPCRKYIRQSQNFLFSESPFMERHVSNTSSFDDVSKNLLTCTFHQVSQIPSIFGKLQDC